ncbi:flavin reductase family protein [Microbacterium sp. 179-I 3D3 NHS]|uniref:flavin reductase family protein n=1 Tax=Microbacterium sp. 179-I 3D3 NHS TaxID=3142382 RepID=UPI0039A297BC
MLIPFSSLNEVAAYHLLTQTVVPRPIAWVLSADAGTGRLNLAPFSFFTAIASDPALLAFSVGNRLGGRVKDTDANAMIGAPLVVHIPGRRQHAGVQASAAPLPNDESELDDPSVDDALDASWEFPLPRLAESPVAFGCTVTRRVELTDEPGAQILVIARAELAWVSDEAVGQDRKGRLRIDPQTVDPLSRLGAGRFGATMPL